MPVSHVLPRRRDCGQGSKGEERCGGGLPGGCHRRHGHLLASAAAAGAIRQSCAAPHTAASLLLRTPTARSPGRPIHLAFLCVFHSTGHLCSACAPLILLRRYSLRLLLCWPTRVAKPGEPQAPGRDGNKQWQCERNAGGEGKPQPFAAELVCVRLRSSAGNAAALPHRWQRCRHLASSHTKAGGPEGSRAHPACRAQQHRASHSLMCCVTARPPSAPCR